MLTSTSSPFQLTAYPIDHPDASSVPYPSPQTVPLTTKEIMDALSGQLPIQPLTPTEMSFPVQPLSPVATITTASQPSYVLTKDTCTHAGVTGASHWDGDRDMLNPPPLHGQEEDEKTEVVSDSVSKLSSAAMDVDETNMTMTGSPSSLPGVGHSSQRRSLSGPSTRRSTRRSKNGSNGSLSTTDNVAPEKTPSTTGEGWVRSRSPKRRRMSEEEVSYCSESSPESCPASPKTPPPMEHPDESQGQSFEHDHEHGSGEDVPKRRRPATENMGLVSVVEIVGKVVVLETHGLKTGSGAQDGEAQVRGAGHLSPTPSSPSRYPKRRQSTRILGRGTACSTSVGGDGLLSGTNKVSAA